MSNSAPIPLARRLEFPRATFFGGAALKNLEDDFFPFFPCKPLKSHKTAKGIFGKIWQKQANIWKNLQKIWRASS